MDTIGKFLHEAGSVVKSGSSALVPLQWITAILASLLSFLVWAKAPFWLEVSAFILLAFIVLQTSFAYHFFLKHDSNALRSEYHALRNKEIDRGVHRGLEPEAGEKK